MTTCLHILNPGGGFADSHKPTCTKCPTPAVEHIAVMAEGTRAQWCGTVCAEHGEQLKNRRGRVEVGPVVEVSV